MSAVDGTFGQRILAASVYAWFQETVLPVWKEHTLQIHSHALEKDLHRQTSKLHYSEPCSDLSQMVLEEDEHRLFYAAKIAYTAIDANLPWNENDPFVSENPSQPSFIGTHRMEKLFLHLRKAPFGAATPAEIRRKETGRASKKKPRTKMFENPLKESGGYKYGNKRSCLCLYAEIRMVMLEYFQSDGESPDVRGRFTGSGGLIFLFFNPKYADKGVCLLQELMMQHQEQTLSTSAFYIMRLFCNLMALFLFPSHSIQFELDVHGRILFTDFGAFVKTFFPDHRVAILSETDASDERVIVTTKFALGTQHSLQTVVTKRPYVGLDSFEAFFCLQGVDPLPLPTATENIKEWIMQCEEDSSLPHFEAQSHDEFY